MRKLLVLVLLAVACLAPSATAQIRQNEKTMHYGRAYLDFGVIHGEEKRGAFVQQYGIPDHAVIVVNFDRNLPTTPGGEIVLSEIVHASNGFAVFVYYAGTGGPVVLNDVGIKWMAMY